MGLGDGFLRTLVIIINTFLILVGIGSLVGGIVLLTMIKATVVPPVLKVCTIGLIIMGVLLIIGTVLGCCAACQKNANLSQGFIVVLVALLILDLSFGIYINVAKPPSNDDYFNMKSNFSNLSTKAKPSDFMKYIMQHGECCGWKNYTEYQENTWPKACCEQKKSKEADQTACTQATVFKTGCEKGSKTVYNDFKIMAVILFVACGMVELVSIILGVYMKYNGDEY